MHEQAHESLASLMAGPPAPSWLIAMAAVMLALATAPLGAALLWRRMAYLGDALAHAAMFGVAVALVAHLPVFLGVLVVALMVAGAVVVMSRRGTLAHDALLGTFAHGLLAAGLALAFLALGRSVDLHEVLFGDVVTMTRTEALMILVGASVIVLFAWRYWEVLVLAAVSEDLALAEGRPARRAQLLLVLAAALLLALAARATGLLLFTALLVLPVAAARAVARSPEGMALLGAAIGVMAVMGGLALAHALGIPSGPLMVTIALVVFVVLHALDHLRA